MKMRLCGEPRLGAECTEVLGKECAQKWKLARVEKFREYLETARDADIHYLTLVGSLFGAERVPESLLDQLFQACQDHMEVEILAFLDYSEINRILYRKDIPENLHLICLQAEDSYLDDEIALLIRSGTVELQLAEIENVRIVKGNGGRWLLVCGEQETPIPFFEPLGFDDAREGGSGYIDLMWENDKITSCTAYQDQRFRYETMEISITPDDSQADIERKIDEKIRNCDQDTLLRMTVSGRTAFGLVMNMRALRERLGRRVFFAEVFDNCMMDVEEDDFAHDISLRSEFIRLALQDGTLSERERSQLIGIGWRALNGSEVIAE